MKTSSGTGRSPAHDVAEASRDHKLMLLVEDQCPSLDMLVHGNPFHRG